MACFWNWHSACNIPFTELLNKKNDKVNKYKSDPFKMVRKIRSITPLDIKSTYYKIVPKLSDEPILISKHYLPIKWKNY